MRSTIALLAAAATLCGCVSTTPQMIYVRLDGQPIPGNPALLQTFETDRTICLGETSKASLSGTVVRSGNVFIDAEAQIGRKNEGNTVMLGCMAQHGYKLVPAPA